MWVHDCPNSCFFSPVPSFLYSSGPHGLGYYPSRHKILLGVVIPRTILDSVRLSAITLQTTSPMMLCAWEYKFPDQEATVQKEGELFIRNKQSQHSIQLFYRTDQKKRKHNSNIQFFPIHSGAILTSPISHIAVFCVIRGNICDHP